MNTELAFQKCIALTIATFVRYFVGLLVTLNLVQLFIIILHCSIRAQGLMRNHLIKKILGGVNKKKSLIPLYFLGNFVRI